jgi:CBS domain-containing protein
MKIVHLMNRDVAVINPDQSLRAAAVTMSAIDAGMLPVVEGARLAGVVTDRDIAVRAMAQGLDPATPVREIMSADVAECTEADDAALVAQTMAERQVRRMPVVGHEGDVVGIVALADLAVGTVLGLSAQTLHRISQKPQDQSMAAARGPVERIMSSDPVVVHIEHSLAEAAHRMKETDVGALPVVDGAELVGFVTDRDLVVRGLSDPSIGLEAKVSDVMTRHVVCCNGQTGLGQAASLMTEQGVRRLVVVDQDRELIGILSLGDLARGDPEGATTAPILRAVSRASEWAKTPGREDPTGGWARRSPPGVPHVYARRPAVRRGG